MRLLRAELRKLRRPLTLWTAVTVVVLTGLFAWGGQKDAAHGVAVAQQNDAFVPTCRDFGLSPGPECDRQIARQLKQDLGYQREYRAHVAGPARQAAALRSPYGAGRFAAGMMASLLGAIALLLLAGGHVGQEWTGKTIKQVLTLEGRRWRVLAAKFASLVLMGVGLLLLTWLVLALLAPLFDAAYPLHAGASAGRALTDSLESSARAVLVIGAFAALGTLSAVITRSTLGGFFLGFAFVLASFILAGFKAVARLTLAYWVTGWMHFRTEGTVLTHVWRDGFYPVADPTLSAGLIGLAAFVGACIAIAWLRFERSDVKV
jgi:ABC-type transport system involved in multi-copper enzyme maturation permease subunit